MNLVQSLGAAAGALFVAFTAGGAATAQSDALQRNEIRAAVSELADLMEASYVFPDVAQRYAEHLRTRMNNGAYDNAADRAALAQTLQTELRGVQDDAHLRITLTGQEAPAGAGPAMVRRAPGSGGTQAFDEERWLADGVGYFRINMLPPTDEAVNRMGQILDQFENADVLIIDLRTCRGGTLPAMDVLLSRIYAAPTELLTMDTRPGANPDVEANFAETPTLRRAPSPSNVIRYVHWATPAAQTSSLSDARIYLLTDRTVSACEHLSLALKSTGRATLVGGTTRGAGHYGSERAFGGRYEIFLPVGRTYVASTGQGWETTGIAPDIAVAPADALNVALREAGVAL